MILSGTGRGAITMKKLILAVALLLATKAGAATLSGATVVADSWNTNGYRYTFSPLISYVDPSTFNAWEVRFFLNGTPTGQNWASASTPMSSPADVSFLFTTTEKSFTVMGVLKLFQNAKINTPGETGTQALVYETNSLTTVTYEAPAAFGAAPQQSLTSETQRAAAVVPIGGTLPLMLTALGLGGWVLRSRTKSATA